MQLQKFVIDVIESLGGVSEPIEYALCEVMIPEEYSSYFHHQTELTLSFDFEVAEENPDSEFVTFGSYILQQVLTLVHENAVNTIRFAEIERLSLANSVEKISAFLQDEPGKLTVHNEQTFLGVWAIYQFRVGIISDDKEETTERIWVDLMTGQRSETMEAMQDQIIYENEPLYTLPVPELININESFKSAYEHVYQSASSNIKRLSESAQLKKDLNRIESYYNELLLENNKKADRKGITEEKKQEISQKSAAISLEKEKQIQEIKNKYDVQIELTLDYGMFYFIPVLAFEISIQFRGKDKCETLYYHPITIQFTRSTKLSSMASVL